MLTLEEAIAAKRAREERGQWVPAAGGTEKPFTHGHYRYQYMFQYTTRTHAYLCLDTDTFLSDDEANNLFRRA